MTWSVILVAATLIVVAYLRVGLTLAIHAYEHRLTREISRYRSRYPTMAKDGVNYEHCEFMADRGLIWGHALVWPVIAAAHLVQRFVTRHLRDPRDLDPAYLRQRIADLEHDLGIGRRRP